MPPRRSTRSAQPSVEPPAAAKPPVTAAKRKRPNPTSKQVDDEKSEAKPRVGAKPKVNGVGKLSSKQVPETDDDEMLVTENEAEVQLPPIKRRRPSPSPAPDDGEVEPQDQVKVKRNTSRSAAAVKRGQKPGQKAVSESEDDEPEQEEDDAYEDEANPKAKATSRARKSSANPRKSAAPSSRAVPKGKPRAASVKISVSSSRDPAAIPRERDDSAELSDENDPAKPQPLSPSKAKARLLMTPRRSFAPSSEEHTPKLRAMSIEDEQEKSLLDPPAPPEPPKTQEVPQAHGEEPNGPTSRLVIHKMALVNFKSYAGRQEIGPFHKVRNSQT
jgi:structural maintenance of chromosome 4